MTPARSQIPEDLSRCSLRDLRLLAGYTTQEDLASQLCVDRRSVLRWERGQTPPPTAVRLFLLSRLQAGATPAAHTTTQPGGTQP